MLQEQEFERVGGTTTIEVDVRVIAATHRNLAIMVRAGQFREDLFYRLNVFPLTLPPLRERQEDIPILSRYFAQRKSARLGRTPCSVTTAAMERLSGYSWPGNIRELENEVERAALLGSGAERLDSAHLSERIHSAGSGAQVQRSGKLKEVVAQVERELIVQALERHQGNRTHAAEDLGVSRWGLVQKIKTYEIEA